MGQLMDKAEAADYLKVTVRHLQRLMSEGRVAHLRVPGQKGNVVRFDVDELERFAEARDAQVYMSALSDISSQRRTSQNVSLARNGDIARAGLEALQASAAEISRQMAEAMQKANAELVEQFRSVKMDPSLLELAVKPWLNRREAIRLSGLPAKALNEGLKTRRLGAKSGGRWLIKRTDLDRFAAAWKPPRRSAK